jgi:hypothetical protein
MSQTKTAKVRVTLFFILVGGVLAMVAVVTDHWAVLSPHLEHHNETCEAAHFGLWRICTARVAVHNKDKSCEHVTPSGGKGSIFLYFFPFLVLSRLQDKLPVGAEFVGRFFCKGSRWKQPEVLCMARAKVEN